MSEIAFAIEKFNRAQSKGGGVRAEVSPGNTLDRNEHWQRVLTVTGTDSVRVGYLLGEITELVVLQVVLQDVEAAHPVLSVPGEIHEAL
jgi:hypothetical protein